MRTIKITVTDDETNRKFGCKSTYDQAFNHAEVARTLLTPLLDLCYVVEYGELPIGDEKHCGNSVIDHRHCADVDKALWWCIDHTIENEVERLELATKLNLSYSARYTDTDGLADGGCTDATE